MFQGKKVKVYLCRCRSHTCVKVPSGYVWSFKCVFFNFIWLRQDFPPWPVKHQQVHIYVKSCENVMRKTDRSRDCFKLPFEHCLRSHTNTYLHVLLFCDKLVSLWRPTGVRFYGTCANMVVTQTVVGTVSNPPWLSSPPINKNTVHKFVACTVSSSPPLSLIQHAQVYVKSNFNLISIHKLCCTCANKWHFQIFFCVFWLTLGV